MLEQFLNSEEYPYSKVNLAIHCKIARKFWDVISLFLASKAQVAAATGNKEYITCSRLCRGEEDVREDYRFVDGSRFLLCCGHYSYHIQCVLSSMAHYVNVFFGLNCPIADTEKCAEETRDGKGGEIHYLGQKEYNSFAIAFLRNRAFVDAFIDKQKLM